MAQCSLVERFRGSPCHNAKVVQTSKIFHRQIPCVPEFLIERPAPSAYPTAISFIGDFRTPGSVQRHVIRRRHPKIYTEAEIAAGQMMSGASSGAAVERYCPDISRLAQKALGRACDFRCRHLRSANEANVLPCWPDILSFGLSAGPMIVPACASTLVVVLDLGLH
jgi:hypothetical protein